MMSVKKYVDGNREFWKVSIHLCSKRNRKIRVQKLRTKIVSEEEAKKIFKKEWQNAANELARRENEGLTWGEVVDSWELFLRKWPSDRWDETTVRDYVSICRNWTKPWLRRCAKDINLGDGYALVEEMKRDGASVQTIYHTRSVINVIFKWGIEHGKIIGKDHSPVHAIELKKRGSETDAEILTRDQVAQFLSEAKKSESEWYPLWLVDLYTGLRASELDGLRKEDVELVSKEKGRELDSSTDPKKNYGLIRVQRQWKKKLGKYGALKGRMWRTVPVSSKLYWFLVDYLEKNDFGSDEFGERVFPILSELRRGQQAQVLRDFCEIHGLKSIKFHTLRACFATHLLAAGVPETQVMKVGGWKDRETMMIYVRRSGIEEAGATEALNFELKKEVPNSVSDEKHSNVVSLFGAR